MKLSENIDRLMAEYESQVNDDGKHTYSETTHNDTGDCGETCCACCDCCDCCSSCAGA